MASECEDPRVKELRQLRPELDMEGVHKLDVALECFVKTRRCDLLRPVALETFLASRCEVGKLRQCSLGEIVDQDALSLALEWPLTDEVISDLSSLFETLSLEETSQILEEPCIDITTTQPVGLAADKAPHWHPRENANPTLDAIENREVQRRKLVITPVNSIELERMLTESLLKLRTLPDFDVLSSKKVDKYWPSEYGAAPFLQAMTFSQLSDLTVSRMMEKRNFTDLKGLGIIEMIKHLSEQSQGKISIKRETLEADLSIAGEHPWQSQLDTLNLVGRGICALLEINSPTARRSSAWLAKLVTRLPEVLSASEFVALAVSREFSLDQSADLIGTSIENIEMLIREAMEHFRHLIQENPGSVSQFSLVLQAPAVSIDELMKVYGDKLLDLRLQQLLLELCLAAVGAKQVEVQGELLKGYWTLCQGRLSILLASILREPLLPDEELTVQLSAVIPELPAELIIPLIRER